MFDVEEYTLELVEKNGILFSKQEQVVSYPKEGNENCFQIEDTSFWFNHRNNCIVDAVRKYCPENVFFDIGGGNGFVAKGLQDHGIRTVLVEPGIEGCLNAKKRQLHNVICSTLENASFKPGSIPSVGLFDVVEHIETDLEFLKSVYSFLKDSGYVFITVPAYNALWSNEDDDAGHFRRYTCTKLENKLKSVGFSIVYSTYIFSILPLPIFLFRALPGRLGLNKKSNELEKHKNEHQEKTGHLQNILNAVWRFERNQVNRGKSIPVGGSCFVIAQKKIAPRR